MITANNYHLSFKESIKRRKKIRAHFCFEFRAFRFAFGLFRRFWFSFAARRSLVGRDTRETESTVSWSVSSTTTTTSTTTTSTTATTTTTAKTTTEEKKNSSSPRSDDFPLFTSFPSKSSSSLRFIFNTSARSR